MPSLRDLESLIQQHPDASDEELLGMAGGGVKGALSKAWEWGNAPLVDLADDTLGRSFGRSSVGKFVTDAAESMSSPLSLAGLALSGGASLAGKAGLLGLSKAARGTEAALNLPYIGEGLSTVGGAQSWGEAAGGGLEAALGTLGLRGAMKRPAIGGSLDQSRLIAEERGSFPLGNIGEPDLPYEDLVARTLGPDGGSSTHLSGASPRGVMVGGVVPPFSGPDLTPEGLARFAKQHRGALEADPSRTLGTWRDEARGTIDLDVSEAVPGLEEALKVAGRRGEKAVFDLDTFQTVPNPSHPDTETFWQELIHRSPKKGLTALDPEFQGTGVRGEERLRREAHGADYVPRTYWNTPASAVEGVVEKATAGGDTYTGWVKKADLLDESDPAQEDRITAILNRVKAQGSDAKHRRTLYERAVKEEGFAGTLATEQRQLWDEASQSYQPNGIRQEAMTFQRQPVLTADARDRLRTPTETGAARATGTSGPWPSAPAYHGSVDLAVAEYRQLLHEAARRHAW